MPDQLRVLVVAPSLPYPPDWAAGIRVFELLRHLAPLHAVTLVAYGEPADDQKVPHLEALGISVRAVPPPWRTKRVAQLASLVSPTAHLMSTFRTREMQQAIDDLRGYREFDLVIIESSLMGGFDFGPKAVVVLDEHNVEYELLRRTAGIERSPLRKLYNWLEYQKFRRDEVAMWRRVDACIFHSEREQAIFRGQVPTTPSAVIPVGIHAQPAMNAFDPPDPNCIVLTGTMDFRPNADATVFFVREILPHILAARPDTTFIAVGKGASAELHRLAGPNVVVTGRVPDVGPYLARASVVVAPIRIGSGTRYKLVEALAVGKPIVSTSIGCEGLPLAHDRELLIADQPEEFASATVGLLEDRERASELGSRGRALVEREFTWAAHWTRLDRFLAQLHVSTATAWTAADGRARPIRR
jgi:glycosyltransferase involved in cell wall biosynthesis